jgi:hypothetical protein
VALEFINGGTGQFSEVISTNLGSFCIAAENVAAGWTTAGDQRFL